MRPLLLYIVAVVMLAGGASAQSTHHQPYAGHEARMIAALSEQEVADLRSGAGMAMALPAELNGYPGPRHVLDLAGQLGLTTDQRAEAERLMAEMRGKALPLDEEVIAAEAELGRLFASGSATAVATDRVARLRGELRSVHLVAHVAMRDALTPDQRSAYDRLRGYAPGRRAH